MQTDLPTMLTVRDNDYQLQVSESYTGTLHQETTTEEYQYRTSLPRAYESLISYNYNEARVHTVMRLARFINDSSSRSTDNKIL